MLIKKINQKVLFIIIVLCLFFSSLPLQIHADGSPPPGAIGSDLYPNLDATMVRMEAETVLITIPENSDNPYGHSLVIATFYMRNMGNETEEMNARFPMNFSEYDFAFERMTGEEYCNSSDFPSIKNLTVYINGIETNISTTTKTFPNYDPNAAPRTFNCWAYFDVTFPPGELVTIQIQYEVGGFKWDPRLVSYKYILQTGQGWYDTIGTADIVVKLPYEVTKNNIWDCRPESYTLKDNTISWHFEDFEPQDNIEFEIIDPSIWSRVVRETINVEKDPQDWEAWGRLGRAYKDVITERHGILLKDVYPDYYNMSVESYQKAISNLPDDAEWHWGYAELMCSDGFIFFRQRNPTEEERIIEMECASELKTALQLDPNLEDARRYLISIYNYTPAFYSEYQLDEVGSLIPLPSYTPVDYIPYVTRTPTASPAVKPSETPEPSATITKTSMPISTVTVDTPSKKVNEAENFGQSKLIATIIAGVICLVLLVVWVRTKRKND